MRLWHEEQDHYGNMRLLHDYEKMRVWYVEQEHYGEHVIITRLYENLIITRLCENVIIT